VRRTPNTTRTTTTDGTKREYPSTQKQRTADPKTCRHEAQREHEREAERDREEGRERGERERE
jgi:hypothetical protein